MRTGPPGDSHIQQILVWPTFQGSSATVAKVTSHSRSLLSGPLSRTSRRRFGRGHRICCVLFKYSKLLWTIKGTLRT